MSLRWEPVEGGERCLVVFGGIGFWVRRRKKGGEVWVADRDGVSLGRYSTLSAGLAAASYAAEKVLARSDRSQGRLDL